MQVRARRPLKLGLYLHTENEIENSLLEYLFHFKQITLWSLRILFWVVRRLVSQRGREMIYKWKVSKVTALRWGFRDPSAYC